jgi:hypothetical protein
MNAMQAAIIDLKRHVLGLIARYAGEAENETLSRCWRTPDAVLTFDFPVSRDEAAEAFDLDPENLTPAD